MQLNFDAPVGIIKDTWLRGEVATGWIQSKVNHCTVHRFNYYIKATTPSKDNKHHKAMVKVWHSTVKIPENAVESLHAAHAQLLNIGQ